MSEQRSIDHSLTVSLRDYSYRAWEHGQELAHLLEGLRVAGGSLSAAPTSPEAGPEMIGLLMKFGAAREASDRLVTTLEGLEETFSELHVAARGAR